MEYFPERPSRIGSVFVCPEKKGFCNGKFREYLYEVELRSPTKTYVANAEMWTEANYKPARAASYANSYWKYPARENDSFKEVIVEGGDVVVVKSIIVSEKK